MKLIFELPRPLAKLCDALQPGPAQTLLPMYFCKGFCPCSGGLRAQLPREQIVLSGTYPPRPRAELLTWVGGRLLSKPRKKIPLSSLHLKPLIVTSMEFGWSLGWELLLKALWLFHQVARVEWEGGGNTKILYKKKVNTCLKRAGVLQG